MSTKQIEIMAKSNKNKITKEQVMVINRTVNRNLEIANGRVNHHKAHKMATDYNRQKYKQFNPE